MDHKTKALIGSLVLAIGGWALAIHLLRRPLPAPEIREVEKVVTVDRIVTKKSHTRITKPDGTVIERDQDSIARTETASQTIEHLTPLSRYSLGLNVRQDLTWPLRDRVYQVELGKRLWNSPLWIKAGLDSQRNVSIGLMLEF